MNHPQVIPECYADTLLVEMLGFEPQHKMGIGEVTNLLVQRFKNNLAVCIIDNDKKKPTDFNDFEIEKIESGIHRYRKPGSKHILLVISPAFEDWFFENANAVKIDPAKYGFRTRKYFKDACKNKNAGENQQLKQFLNTLKQKKAPGFVQLKTWICESAGLDEKDL
jgi:hypothetical protein